MWTQKEPYYLKKEKLMNELDEIMARMAMMEGRLDPGHYYLVASGQIPLEVCYIPPELQPLQILLESKCLSCDYYLANSDKWQQHEDSYRDQQPICNQRRLFCLTCPHDTKDTNLGKVQQNEKKR